MREFTPFVNSFYTFILGERITPSAIHFSNDFQEYNIGDLPEEKDPGNYASVSGIKSLLGITKLEEVPDYFTGECRLDKNFEDGSQQIVALLKDPVTKTEKSYTCEELVALIISYMRLSALQYLKRKPIISDDPLNIDLEKVVIGIPANFPEVKKDSLRSAALMSGFREVTYFDFFPTSFFL